ncbi:MAG TPA: lycopene cyclase domain-containing protein [Ferruginibacter sp.]|nr:lycopene cyclase domain-containing protein [Ferruginibacter sp.]HQR00844.1 lycopene cyclase domain-containing protein [Ferruginibacter sp.]
MNNHYTYFLILAASFAGPFFLSFDKKVAFYKQWKYVLPAMLLPAALYIAWDIYFTSRAVWSFNADYITGIKLSNLPLEEVLFFLIVPYCCVFIYACIRAYFPKLKEKKWADTIMIVMATGLLIAGFAYREKYYTGWTFLLTGFFICCIYMYRGYFKGFDAVSFLVSYLVCLVPFLIVNGFLTALPVVRYNDVENLGIRIHTIPFEDSFYGMLLVLMNIVIYEKLKSREGR